MVLLFSARAEREEVKRRVSKEEEIGGEGGEEIEEIERRIE
jgi:hypothetical protein